MHARELLADLTQRRVNAFFTLARKIPADKLTTSPGGKARTPLDLIQEVGALPAFFAGVVRERKMPEFDEAMMTEFKANQTRLTTIDEAEAACRKGTDELLDALGGLSDEELLEQVSFPWDPIPYTLAAMAAGHLWNVGYHEGQLSYILDLAG